MPVNELHAVMLTLADGTRRDELFVNRHAAEVWLALLPVLQINGQYTDVRRAVIRPCGWGWN